MKIEVETKLILTVPEPGIVLASDIVLAAEQVINSQCCRFIMPGTNTKVGIRIHTLKIEKVIK